ncbi:GntR family transcriptional regulator [Microbacterium thalassium]|uniref:DNA-binding GntR family transcriptional regulator n=1 Tax=Microbacterium thalassium TaxID=362649 RepID=A0A7X0KTW5_9MICO|nr:GntR family transcriptional regulator [Microbacterium thalassium]MBB6390541.1 DNA-binding GntR family transcriptional regulator [Microbacterium thalassium]GLK25652.1 hypothetical protein GCM10017607_29710 [Microbacterium thalassium]
MSDEPALSVRPVRDRRPLSVQVYDRLVEALRENGHPGDPIAPEIELAAQLGVSRTVLREALRLLEEDGIIERGADPRRRQLAHPSARPPAFNAPLEEMLRATGRMRVDVVRTERLTSTNWSRVLLELDDAEDELLCRESLFHVDGEPVASAVEFVPTREGAVPLALVDRADGAPQTLLASLGAQFRARCVPSLWRMGAAGSAGSRTGFKQVPRGHLTSLTTVLSKSGRPVFLAKYLIRLDAAVLVVGEDPDGPDPLTLDSL